MGLGKCFASLRFKLSVFYMLMKFLPKNSLLSPLFRSCNSAASERERSGQGI